MAAPASAVPTAAQLQQLASQFPQGSADWQTFMNLAADPSQWNNANVQANLAVLASPQNTGKATYNPAIAAAAGAGTPLDANGNPISTVPSGLPPQYNFAPAGFSTPSFSGADLNPSAMMTPIGTDTTVNGSGTTPVSTGVNANGVGSQMRAQNIVGAPGGRQPSGGQNSPNDPTTGNTGDTGSTGSTIGSILSKLGINSSSVIPSAVATGLGLWNLLGSKAAYTNAGNVVNTAEQNAGNEVNSTAQAGATNLGTATQTGNNLLGDLYHSTTSATSPYSTAGATAANQLTTALAPGGQLNPSSLTPEQILQQNPGYQFQLEEGNQQLQRQLAAMGLDNSGGALKAGQQFVQGLASNAYQQAFQNEQTQNQNYFGNLYNASGLGTTANAQNITSGEAFGAPQATNDITTANNQAALNLTGSQYQGNANVSGAGAVAGGDILGAQAQQTFIQQLLAMIPQLFSGSSTTGTNPFGLTGSDTAGLANLAGLVYA